MQKMGKLLGVVLIFLVCTACGYQFGRGELSATYRTISIPYAKGDQKGELTAELIKKMAATGAFVYAKEGGDLLLQVELVEFREENLEFRYDRDKEGHLKNSIIPTETRLTASAEVVVIEAASGAKIRGPIRIFASTEFDHTYYATRNEINIFSLGQLNDFDAARDAVIAPLCRNLAEKIIEYVINS